MLCELAYFSHIDIICLKHCKESASRAISFAYPNGPAYEHGYGYEHVMHFSHNPMPEYSNCVNKLSILQLNSNEEISLPCLTSFEILK